MADPRGAPAPQSPLRQLWQSKKRRKRQRAQTQWARMYAMQAAEREEGRKRQHRCPLCVILSSSLTISAFPPLPFSFILFPAKGCFLGRRLLGTVSLIASVILHRRLPVFRRALFICGAANTHRKASHLLLPSLKAKLAIRGTLCVTQFTLQHVDIELIKFILTFKSFVSVNLHSLKQRAWDHRPALHSAFQIPLCMQQRMLGGSSRLLDR